MTISKFWPRARIWLERAARLRSQSPRRLRLLESLSLGERRFVALIELEQSRFLLGGTASSLVLLARLEPKPEENPAGHWKQGPVGKGKEIDARRSGLN